MVFKKELYAPTLRNKLVEEMAGCGYKRFGGTPVDYDKYLRFIFDLTCKKISLENGALKPLHFDPYVFFPLLKYANPEIFEKLNKSFFNGEDKLSNETFELCLNFLKDIDGSFAGRHINPAILIQPVDHMPVEAGNLDPKWIAGRKPFDVNKADETVPVPTQTNSVFVVSVLKPFGLFNLLRIPAEGIINFYANGNFEYTGSNLLLKPGRCYQRSHTPCPAISQLYG